ncbi:ATP-dependent DNA helicase [Halorhodospira halophila]|uniref:Helicase c2 n=1 Tax=Halorhodospira halophila (strain DSM 244 / SL1) TaxID=349124 RepID=A1WUF6_HALHL|nr:ATP-dependent DNA helicase [Halorhodospira halophila]ABM61318.1 helicase c2 [Halorhodospira halophila SL1]MBK1729099.1 ATP-dependent DNA helicase [Halorhodospira halophila]
MDSSPATGAFAEAVVSELDVGGAVSRAIEGFAPRPGQLRLGAAVADALADDEVLVAEAGTGIGKTYAYLVPTLLDGRRVIISTGTRTLQDQLYHRDLPRVRAALQAATPRPMRAALLKGRANYLCRYRLQRAVEEGPFTAPDEVEQIETAAQWARQTESGDLAEAPEGVEGVAERITSTPERCLGQGCPAYDECFFYEARRRAHEADVLVVNHHLLLADWAVKDAGYGAVLPEAQAVVLDEAHLLPDTAARFFGHSVSARALRDLVRDVRIADRREAGDMPDLRAAVDTLESAVAELRLALEGGEQRDAWYVVAEQGAAEAAAALRGATAGLERVLAAAAERGPELEACHRRAGELGEALGRFLAPEAEGEVQWYETRGRGFALHLTPLDVGGSFRRRMEREASAWVLLSATLAVGSSFAAFRRRLGLAESVRTEQLASPFDYARQSLLYCPSGLPLPNQAGYDQAVVARAQEVIDCTPGGVFLLFTSHRALRLAREQLETSLTRPLLVQGDAPQGRLLDAFSRAGDAVLLGTASFWQGVDIRGAALSAVIIDRLPFAAPGDPVTAARQRAVEEAGGVAFRDILLPEAVIALKQGAGRLIRDDADRGVLMIADPRLLGKPYGRLFRSSLPEMPLTRRVEDVQAFWEDES